MELLFETFPLSGRCDWYWLELTFIQTLAVELRFLNFCFLLFLGSPLLLKEESRTLHAVYGLEYSTLAATAFACASKILRLFDSDVGVVGGAGHRGARSVATLMPYMQAASSVIHMLCLGYVFLFTGLVTGYSSLLRLGPGLLWSLPNKVLICHRCCQRFSVSIISSYSICAILIEICAATFTIEAGEVDTHSEKEVA